MGRLVRVLLVFVLKHFFLLLQIQHFCVLRIIIFEDICIGSSGAYSMIIAPVAFEFAVDAVAVIFAFVIAEVIFLRRRFADKQLYFLAYLFYASQA